MDFDTLIYILFIVGSVIISIYRGKKKGQQKKPTIPEILDGDIFGQILKQEPVAEEKTTDAPAQSFWEDDFKPEPAYEMEALMPEENDREISPEPEVFPDFGLTEKAKIEKYIEEVEHDFSREGQRTVRIDDSADENIFVWEQKEEEVSFEFEPRKAIIYSEILKRPEW